MTFEPLSTSQRNGIIVVVAFALLSALAFAYIALRTVPFGVTLSPKRHKNTSRPPEILFFRTQIGHYAGCLILGNMLISVAGLIDFVWVFRSGLSEGPACSAQAILMEIGVWATCWFTGALGIHALSSLGLRVRPARWRSPVFVVLGWTIACVAALAPLLNSDVYGPNGTSCSIASSYTKEIFVVGALPVVIVALVSSVAYCYIYIVLHGKPDVNSTEKPRGPNKNSQRREDRSIEYHKFISMVIRTIFWFPLASVLLLLPFCVTQIIMSAGYSVPSEASVFANVCVSMLGFVNIALLCNTSRLLRPVCHASCAPKLFTDSATTFGHDSLDESLDVSMPTFILEPSTPPYESAWREVVPPVFSDMMLPEEPLVTSQQSDTKEPEILVQSKLVTDSPSHTASLGFDSPRAPFVTRQIRRQSSTQDTQDGKRVFQPMANLKALRNGANVPAFKSKPPAALNHSRASVPCLEIDTWNVRRSQPRAHSSHPYVPTMALSNNDLDPTADTVRVSKPRPLPKIPEPNNKEEDTDVFLSTPRRLRGQSAITITTVWSQETGYTMASSPVMESQEENQRQLIANATGMMLDGQVRMGEASRRHATLPASHVRYREPPPLRPASLSTHFPTPMPWNSGSFVITGPTGSAV